MGLCILYACSTQKDTATSRAMQNLTSRYNYIYNSNLILNAYVAGLQDGYQENYADILPVYINPAAASPGIPASANEQPLDEIIAKARLLIAEKSFGNYIDEAYLLLGKAYFYKADYFTAAEYFDYTANTYKSDKQTVLQALNWKARCYMQLQNLQKAAKIVDSMEFMLDSVKHNRSEPLATLAQISLELKRNPEAIAYLQSAIHESDNPQNKTRWTYILAQLYERQHQTEQALQHYKKVQHSNGNFDLYFYSNLNRINLSADSTGDRNLRSAQLLSLLKDDKNTDFTDQVYYYTAEAYSSNRAYPTAAAYYSRAVQASSKNTYQKGRAYLKLADLNFSEFRDYLKAKLYYDSAINTLPPTYPAYELIVKKSQNLKYLADRYITIARQDTLQAMARLPLEERLEKIRQLQLVPKVAATGPEATAGLATRTAASSGFYFNNPGALALGLADFLKIWGNRKQEDNWRQSIRKTGQTNTLNAPNVEALGSSSDLNANTVSGDATVQVYLATIPVNENMLQASNQKIVEAYYEIASFYQHELNDPVEAIRIYKLILSRFPENNYLPAIHYSLYLAYKGIDSTMVEQHKQVLLSKYPNTSYVKTILDPGFLQKQSAFDLELKTRYNNLFSIYLAKQYREVIKTVDSISHIAPENYLDPQFQYLRAIAVGHTQPIDSLTRAFLTIKNKFPADQLIVPLVNQHLDYIAQHLAEFKRRKTALTDFDSNESPFQMPFKPATAIVKAAAQPKAAITPTPVPASALEKNKPANTAANLFTPGSASSSYYFVIDVADASLTLSSSRFGIGQFNRGNYSQDGLRHQIVEFDDDQLLYVGNFSNFADVNQYAAAITPQLKKIMKVPESKYTAFIISKENFEKLKSKVLVNQYLEYYKNNLVK
jgi:tetratricopeptide (TPR) repeat protein